MQIMKRVSAVLPGRTPRTTVVWRATVAHFAFGVGAGALYGLLAPRRFREGTGIAYAGLIWATSYLGWLPALRSTRLSPATTACVRSATPRGTWSTGSHSRRACASLDHAEALAGHLRPMVTATSRCRRPKL